MKTTGEVKELLRACRQVDVHVHTHLCDGAAEMTVKNIAAVAKKKGNGAVVLVPHFHKQISDGTETLYTDTDESIFMALRDEIDVYSRQGDVKFLLSTETDILSKDGTLSLSISPEAERALDMITPTMNFSLLLPYRMVALTRAKDRDALHASGEYLCEAQKVGGIAAVLEAMYECEANAILHTPYPSILGHFFSAHSFNSQYTWFGAEEQHLPIMTAGAKKVVEACRKANALVDITGTGLGTMTVEQKCSRDGFLYYFQRDFINQCKGAGISVFPGSDAHNLAKVGEVSYHYAAFDL